MLTPGFGVMIVGILLDSALTSANLSLSCAAPPCLKCVLTFAKLSKIKILFLPLWMLRTLHIKQGAD